MSLDAVNLLFHDADVASDADLPLAVDALIEFMNSDPQTVELLRIAEAKTKALHRSLRDEAIACLTLVLTQIAQQAETTTKLNKLQNNFETLLATLATDGNDTKFLFDSANRDAAEVSHIFESDELSKVLAWTKYLQSRTMLCSRVAAMFFKSVARVF